MTASAADLALFAPALVAGLLVVATHVPLGHQVLQRGIIFIDLAIAQIAALGVLLAQAFGLAEQTLWVQAAAAAAALGGALLLSFTERRWPQQQEAIIGVIFVLAASAALLLLSQDPHAGERLQALLAGQILWVTWDDVVPVALLYGGVLLVWFGVGAHLGRLGFYTLFALSVTASVQLIGLYLVFATLVIPALAVYAHPPAARLLRGYLIGALGYLIGFFVSTGLDLPTGAVIVWCLAGCALLFARRR